MSTSTFTLLLSSEAMVSSSSMLLYVHRNRADCSIRDGEPRTSTSTFTQLLSSVGQADGSFSLHTRQPLRLYQGEVWECDRVGDIKITRYQN